MFTFDLSLYFPIPLLTTESYVSLTKDLQRAAPSQPPPHVTKALQSMAATLVEVKAGLVSRIDKDLPASLQRAFDIFVDRVWNEVRVRLEFYDIYNYEGIQKLTEAERMSIDYDTQLERSRTAATIHARLFGDGTDFLRSKYPQQATQMATRLEWLESKQLDTELADLVGHELVDLLKVCQVRYEAMISERSTRDGKSSADLRELRNKLRMQIYAYCGAVGSMLDPDSPASLEQVEAALRPVLSYRAQTRRKGATPDESALEDEFMPDEATDDAPRDEPAESDESVTDAAE
jgi:hypothetical protein